MVNRIGAGSEQGLPSAVPSPQATQSPAQSKPFMDSINAELKKRGITIDPLAGGMADVDLLSSFSRDQWAAIAAMLKKLGRPVQGVQEAKIALTVEYGDMTSKATSFGELYQQLQADYIPGLDGDGYKVPKTTVQLQDPLVIDTLIRGVYQSTLKRDPNAEEFAARRSELEAVINKGSTVTPQGQGKAIATPGFTQAGAEAMIKQKIETGAPEVQEDLAQAQSIEFADFIGKLGK